MKKKNEIRKISLFTNPENHQKINVDFSNENNFVFVIILKILGKLNNIHRIEQKMRSFLTRRLIIKMEKVWQIK